MYKKAIAALLALSMITSTAIAYGSVENGEEKGQEVIQGVPEGPGEVLGDRVVSQGSEDLGGVPGDSQGDSGGIKIREEKVEIKDGSINFGNSNIQINSYNSIDFPGTFTVDTTTGDISGAPVKLVNTGETELIVYAEKCKSMNSTSPKIVTPSTFSDWTSLDETETLSYMALGFTLNGSSTYWFSDESSQQPEEVYRLQPGESITLEVTGKSGTKWPSNCTIEYDCTLGLEVIPMTKIIEVPEITEIPEIPEMPEQPETPETPETPEDQEIPEDTETPETPEETETPEQPEEPEIPETTETTETPEQPEDTETSEQPDQSEEAADDNELSEEEPKDTEDYFEQKHELEVSTDSLYESTGADEAANE